MFTDYHSHILPDIDDGARNIEQTQKMLEILAQQGVERSIATPHFYAHRETSVEDYLAKRQKAFEQISPEKYCVKEIRLGSEVALENNISEYKDIEKLAIEGTSLILLEPPYSGYRKNLPEEVHNIACQYKLKPVIAHIHRYINLYRNSEIEELLKLDAIFQINIEAFQFFSEKKFVKRLIKEEYPIIFGTDSHNTDTRKPNFDILLKKEKKFKDIIEKSNAVFDKYSL